MRNDVFGQVKYNSITLPMLNPIMIARQIVLRGLVVQKGIMENVCCVFFFFGNLIKILREVIVSLYIF